MTRDGIMRIDQQLHYSPLFPPVTIRSTKDSRQPYAEHVHESFSIGVIFNGKTRLRCKKEEFTALAGQIVVFTPFEPHSCNPIDGGSRGYHMFYIDSAWLQRACLPQNCVLAVQKRVLSQPSLFADMIGFAEAVENNRHFARWESVIKHVIASSSEVVSRDEDDMPPPAFAAFAEYGFDAPNETILAAQLGVERETFIRSFRRAIGMTPGAYRQCLRLAHAVRLLRNGESIVHAALNSGFCDQSHFHRMCVKYLSATPAQLRPGTSHSSKT